MKILLCLSIAFAMTAATPPPTMAYDFLVKRECSITFKGHVPMHLSHPLICWLSVPANKKSSLVPGLSVLIRC
jgi:hypothetical protein